MLGVWALPAVQAGVGSLFLYLPVKLQALVYDILPSATAVFSYAIGSRKLSANKQFFVGAQTVVSLLQTTQNDSCIKMVSDESHFNVSLIVIDKVTRQCPQTTTFLKRKESRSGIEPRSFRLPYR